MEIADVRKRVRETIDRARRQAATRRGRNEEAEREFQRLLEFIAVPLFRQLANVLKIEGYQFNVFTPSGSVRLGSERSGEDYIEIVLDTSGDEPRVLGRIGRSRGRRVINEERVVGAGSPERITEEDLLAFVLKELEPFVDR
jgi:hypothetical protein